MDSTYNTQAIILDRKPWNENGLQVCLYSPERGQIFLQARGALKKGAKLAGHLEPLILGDFMVVKGRQGDYLGSARGEKFYLNIKEDLEKLKYASLALRIVKNYTKPDLADPEVFRVLRDYLEFLDSSEFSQKNGLLYTAFLFKSCPPLGFSPCLDRCLFCGQTLNQSFREFEFAEGGLICPSCSSKKESTKQISLSPDTLKAAKFVNSQNFSQINKLSLKEKNYSELVNLVNLFFKYHILG